MVCYTQDALNSVCQKLQEQKLKGGNGIDAETIDVDVFHLTIDVETEQTLELLTVAPRSDFNNDGGRPVCYTRCKSTKEAPWGEWARTR